MIPPELTQIRMTAGEFDTFVERFPGNGTHDLLNGTFSEKIPPDPCSTRLAGYVYACIWLHLRQSGLGGNVSSPYRGYLVSERRLLPSPVYYAPGRPFDFYSDRPDPPDLAVAVVSDEDNPGELNDLAAKLPHYQAAGVIVWVILPRAQRAEIHDPAVDPAQPPEQLGRDDALQVPDLLPGFSLPLREIFSEPD